jgi:hypothetical protein
MTTALTTSLTLAALLLAALLLGHAAAVMLAPITAAL